MPRPQSSELQVNAERTLRQMHGSLTEVKQSLRSSRESLDHLDAVMGKKPEKNSQQS
jgi:hypothetical protein